MRKAFNFYRSYFDVAKELNDKDRLSFYDALMTRQFTGVELKLEGMAALTCELLAHPPCIKIGLFAPLLPSSNIAT
jgi:hypothetical protein